MKAICVRQPFASLICMGIKDVENRTWSPKINPGKILIVASQAKVPGNFLEKNMIENSTAMNNAIMMGNFPDFDKLPTSAVIGYVEIEEFAKERPDSIWADFPDPKNFFWKLKNAYVFDEPQLLGFKGKLNVFDIPEISEDNLPKAHQVKLAHPTLKGKCLTLPVSADIFKEASEFKGAYEIVFRYSNTDELMQILMPNEDNFDFIDLDSVELACEGKKTKYKLNGKFLANATDSKGKDMMGYSWFSDDELEILVCVLILGEKIG